MFTQKFKKIAMILLMVLLGITMLWGCGNLTNKLPSSKGPGYWETENGVMWFYSEGTGEKWNYAAGEIISGNAHIPISIEWDHMGFITVYDGDGTVLFTGRTSMNTFERDAGKCKVKVHEWTEKELFPEKVLTAVFVGEDRGDKSISE